MKLPIGISIAGAAALSIPIAYILYAALSPSSLCKNLSCVSMPGMSSYSLKATYTDTSQVYRALYASENRYIRIEAKVTNPQDAKQDIHASVTRMKALFEKAPAPYPGDISDSVVCDPAFVPSYHEEKTSDGTLQYFIGYLNDRLTFGSCSKENAQYRGIMAFTYCPKEKLSIRFELIAPGDDYASHEKGITDSVRALTCTK